MSVNLLMGFKAGTDYRGIRGHIFPKAKRYSGKGFFQRDPDRLPRVYSTCQIKKRGKYESISWVIQVNAKEKDSKLCSGN